MKLSCFWKETFSNHLYTRSLIYIKILTIIFYLTYIQRSQLSLVLLDFLIYSLIKSGIAIQDIDPFLEILVFYTESPHIYGRYSWSYHFWSPGNRCWQNKYWTSISRSTHRLGSPTLQKPISPLVSINDSCILDASSVAMEKGKTLSSIYSIAYYHFHFENN